MQSIKPNCAIGSCVADRYYLVDNVYALESGYMGPFRNTRYHLDDFRGVPVETMSRQEKFNLTHSRLCNVVERTFGVLKNQWQILDGVPYCHRTKQKMIIISCFALHNYLFSREHGLGSPTYPPSPWVQLNASNSMSAVRKFISLGMWGQ